MLISLVTTPQSILTNILSSLHQEHDWELTRANGNDPVKWVLQPAPEEMNWSVVLKTMRGLGKTEGFGDESALVIEQSQTFVFQHNHLWKWRLLMVQQALKECKGRKISTWHLQWNWFNFYLGIVAC